MPFVSIEQVWEEIRATEVHNILMDNVEYVLAVSILPYRNYVLSVWVYVGVLYK